MQSLVVFCGSSSGNNPLYVQVATELGELLAKRNIRLIYGGAQVGLMGAVADGCLTRGGQVTGVIPTFLKRKEVVHSSLTELLIVDTMHERKRIMSDLSQGCIALPGGFGTLEELFELLTDAQLGQYHHPIGLLNVDGYYDQLLVLLQSMVSNGLLRQENYDMLLVSKDVTELLTKMAQYTNPKIEKWL